MASPAAATTESLSYPLFDDSPYSVASSERRQRWWYADGIWLDQGQTGAVVGFAWTHWLADRGVRVTDGELGEEYARALYREARRVTGEDEKLDQGARTEAGAFVLQSRGLLDQCYAFSGTESIVLALLERGPVVASLSWFQSMSAPTEVDGWTVCRVDADSQVAGGHCVVLNGVVLDTTIAGAKGFVRFKNSWGRGWGDGGQAMISIEDLGKAIDGHATLLPIPAASALRTGLRPDVATDGVPYGPLDVRYEQTAIGSDLWTRRDTVGAASYADAIARGIQHVETKPPLTIGIKGAWGAGKTSLMRMIRDRLEWPGRDGSADELRRIHLTATSAKKVAPAGTGTVQSAQDLGEVTNLTLLRTLRSADAGSRGASPRSARPRLKAALGAADADSPSRDDARRWRPTVWFNPWMYETGEQVWAGLAHEIITQVTERMSRVEQEHFWLHLNLKRVDEQAVRRKIYGLVLDRLVPYAIAGLFFVLAGTVAIIAGVGWEAMLAVAGGPGVLLVGTGVTATSVLRGRPGGGLSALVGPATDIRQAASGQFAGTFENLVENPDYRSRSGSFYLVHTDVQRVLDLVATPERPLVIFVDDLDRCSPGTVVQVIEAINLFVAGAYPNSIFVIAMEPEMVAAHVEAAYGNLVAKLEQTSGTTAQSFDLGWRFLEKIVQLPLAMPAMETPSAMAFYDSLFPTDVAAQPAAAEPPPEAADGHAIEQALSDASLSEAVNIAGDVQYAAGSKEAVRAVIERRLTSSDPEVKEVIAYASQHLHRNPREIKRFVNLFRFFTMIYAERKLEGLPTPTSLHEVAKLAVLGIRWPGFLSALAVPAGGAGDRTVFELLEAPPGTGRAAQRDAALKRELIAAGVSEATTTRLMSPELRRFLASDPKVGSGVRGYL